MSTLLEGARRLAGRGSGVGPRVDGLAAAARAARGRLDDTLVDGAEAVANRAAERLRLSADHTVVAVAGATGSGKSSTFNALTGLELSAVGVRRPTTSWATACVWGSDGAEELLTWLGIPPRHQTTRDSMLDSRREDSALEGVVLLDLPDHDSTEVSHRLEVDRLVQLADLLVWVLDPQKYADAAVHDRYLAPMGSHAEVMVIVLNHVDTVPEDRLPAMLADIRRLLDAEGLQQVPVFAISARNGTGIDSLRAEVARRVTQKKLVRTRLEADVRVAAQRLADAGGTAQPRGLPESRVSHLETALAEAAGVPTVVSAVERSTRARAGRATGWPVVTWLSRLRPDPLKRLHLDLGGAGRQLTGNPTTSLPATTPVQRARVDTEVRALAEDASQGLGRPWAESVRRASVSRLPELGDRLDRAIGATDLGAARVPAWAAAVRGVQWLLLLLAFGGLAWLALLAGMSFLGLPEPSTPKTQGWPLPTLMLLGGVLLGVLLAMLCRALVRLTARRRAASADRRLRAAVHEVAEELVAGPVRAELAAYDEARRGLLTALK